MWKKICVFASIATISSFTALGDITQIATVPPNYTPGSPITITIDVQGTLESDQSIGGFNVELVELDDSNNATSPNWGLDDTLISSGTNPPQVSGHTDPKFFDFNYTGSTPPTPPMNFSFALTIPSDYVKQRVQLNFSRIQGFSLVPFQTVILPVPPIITALTPTSSSMDENTSQDITVTANDNTAGGDVTRIEWFVDDAGMTGVPALDTAFSISPVSNTFTLAAGFDSAASILVGVRVTNTAGAVATDSTAINVNNVNRAPTIGVVTPTTAPDNRDDLTEGSLTAVFTVNATDADTDNLTFDFFLVGHPTDPADSEVLTEAEMTSAGFTVAKTGSANASSTLTITSIPRDWVEHPDKNSNEIIRCDVTDDDTNTLTSSHVFYVNFLDLNRAPNQPSVAVTSDPASNPKKDATLTCTVTGAGDPDDDSGESYTEPLSYTYVWAKQGNPTITNGPKASLTDSISATQKGDIWSCTVTVTDDPHADSSNQLSTNSAASNSITIENSDPEPKDASEVPAAVTVDNTTEFTIIVLSATLDPAHQGQTFNLNNLIKDVDGDSLTFTQVTPPGMMDSFSLDTGTGTITFTPSAGGTNNEFDESLVFTATDGVTRGATAQITLNLLVRNNQLPILSALSPNPASVPDITEEETQTYSLSATDNDGDDSAITYAWFIGTSTTAVSGQTSNSFTFTPDSTTVVHPLSSDTVNIKVEVTDDRSGVSEQIWTQTVTDVNNIPDIGTTSVALGIVGGGTGLNSGAGIDDAIKAMITAGATDADTEDVIWYKVVWTDDAGATNVIRTTILPLGVVEDTLPAGQVKGKTITATVTALDYATGTTTAVGGESTGSVTDSLTTVNTAPVATDDDTSTTAGAAETDEDTATTVAIVVLANDTDADTDTDSLSVLSFNTTGVLGTITKTGDTFSYDPNGQFESLGRDGDNTADTDTETFTYIVTDSDGGTDTGTVTLTINGVNDAPVAARATGFTKANETTTDPIILSATDVDSDIASFWGGDNNAGTGFTEFSGSNVIPSANGGMVVLRQSVRRTTGSPGSIDVDYTPPNASFTGVDTFYYFVRDAKAAPGGGSLDSAVVDVTVTVGSPIWYPFFSFEPVSGFEWYNVQILDSNGDLAFEKNVNGTTMTPEEYFDFAGLLPGNYTWEYRTWNGQRLDLSAFGSVMTGDSLTVDYGLAADGFTPSDGSDITDLGNGKLQLCFRVDDARGFQIKVTGSATGYSNTFTKIFAPKADGTIPLNEDQKFLITVPQADTYTIELRGFNRYDECIAAGESDCSGSSADPADAVDFVAFNSSPVMVSAFTEATLTSADKPTIAFTPKKPISTGTTGTAKTTLSWNPVPGAMGYIVYLASAGQIIYNYENVGNVTSITVPSMKPGAFTFIVRPRNSLGVGAYSEVRSFDVISDSTVPIINAVNISASPSSTLIFTLADNTQTLASVDVFHEVIEVTGETELSGWDAKYTNRSVSANMVTISGAGHAGIGFRTGDWVSVRTKDSNGNPLTGFKTIQLNVTR